VPRAAAIRWTTWLLEVAVAPRIPPKQHRQAWQPRRWRFNPYLPHNAYPFQATTLPAPSLHTVLPLQKHYTAFSPYALHVYHRCQYTPPATHFLRMTVFFWTFVGFYITPPAGRWCGTISLIMPWSPSLAPCTLLAWGRCLTSRNSSLTNRRLPTTPPPQPACHRYRKPVLLTPPPDGHFHGGTTTRTPPRPSFPPRACAAKFLVAPARACTFSISGSSIPSCAPSPHYFLFCPRARHLAATSASSLAPTMPHLPYAHIADEAILLTLLVMFGIVF